MSEDLELERSGAANWREYKAEARRMKEMVSWVWRELVSREGRVFVGKMVGWMILSCILTIVLPLTFGRITDLLDPRRQQLRPLLGLLALYGVLLLARQVVRYRQGLTREYLFGSNLRQLDQRTTELFLEKLLGMPPIYNNQLNEANVKKGYDRVFGLEYMF